MHALACMYHTLYMYITVVYCTSHTVLTVHYCTHDCTVVYCSVQDERRVCVCVCVCVSYGDVVELVVELLLVVCTLTHMLHHVRRQEEVDKFR